jgi:hypothetical protein
MAKKNQQKVCNIGQCENNAPEDQAYCEKCTCTVKDCLSEAVCWCFGKEHGECEKCHDFCREVCTVDGCNEDAEFFYGEDILGWCVSHNCKKCEVALADNGELCSQCSYEEGEARENALMADGIGA